MELNYYDRMGNVIPTKNDTINVGKNSFSGGILNMYETIFTENADEPNDKYVDVSGRNNISIFGDADFLQVYLRIDDEEGNPDKYLSLLFEEDEYDSIISFLETLKKYRNHE